MHVLQTAPTPEGYKIGCGLYGN